MRLGLSALILTIFLSPALAQAQNNRGFTMTVPPEVAGQEVLDQPNLWVMEVSYKPIRMIRMELTDPVTKEKTSELVWYLVWKSTVRPVEVPQQTQSLKPENSEDPLPTPMFVPEFRIVAEDNNVVRTYPDLILPEAHAAIVKRERELYPTNLATMQELPEPGKTVYGVAIWKGINPTVDYFSIQMLGFSNGYKVIQGPDGEPVRLRRVIVQKYWRPGDEYEEDEKEIRYDGKPTWEYLPEPTDALPPKEEQPYEEPGTTLPPENPTPENGTPENPTPENPTPENETPENPTPENETR